MRFQSYFNTAVQLITAFDGSMPLAHYIKQYFTRHKKHGSKDRKYIAHLCYCYYRLGHSLKTLPVEERLKTAIFLCNDAIDDWAVVFTPEWVSGHLSSLNERIAFIKTIHPFEVEQVFPWHEALGEGIDTSAFASSHLIQPDLFLRIRPGKEKAVTEKLQQQNINFDKVGGSAIALSNTTKVDAMLELNKEAVVQDLSSQQIAKFLQLVKNAKASGPVNIWDCCAASGGKSILAVDVFGKVALTVSDIRPSIIHNLQQRFKEAGIQHYKSFTADLTDAHAAISALQYDIIICDAPCSGSGTWGRTPEQLYFFHPEKINHYSSLQQKIIRTVLPRVKAGGYFLYITCSVFAQENEEAVKIIQQNGLTLVGKEMLKGYDNKADTMFAALFKK